MRTADVADPIKKPVALPPGVTQAMIDASLAANPSASRGGYEGVGDTYTGPGPAAAASAAASAAPATSSSPIPGVDPFALAQANDAYTRAVASVNGRRGSTLSQYGFKASGFDDSGNPTDLEVDPTSMYGSYQQLLDKQAQDSMAAEEAGSGRGFSGGLANQAEGRLRYTQGGERLNLGTGLLSSLGSLNQELLAASAARGTALTNAYLDPTRTAIDNSDWTPYQTTPDDPTTNTFAPPPIIPPVSKPPPKPNTPAKAAVLAQKVVAKKVTANKTGATASKARGVISIH